MKKVIIFGLTQLAELLYDCLVESKEYEIGGYTVDREYIEKNTINGLPVVPFDEVETFFSVNDYSIFICVGYNHMNQTRAEKFASAKQKGYNIETYVDPTSIVLSPLGEGSIVMEGAIIGRKCRIGQGNIFLPAAHIAHHAIIGDFNFFTISVAVAGNIKIGNQCVFGNNCTIRNNLEIGNGTLVGAGCYLSENTAENSVYVPARSYCLSHKKSIDMHI